MRKQKSQPRNHGISSHWWFGPNQSIVSWNHEEAKILGTQKQSQLILTLRIRKPLKTGYFEVLSPFHCRVQWILRDPLLVMPLTPLLWREAKTSDLQLRRVVLLEDGCVSSSKSHDGSMGLVYLFTCTITKVNSIQVTILYIDPMGMELFQNVVLFL